MKIKNYKKSILARCTEQEFKRIHEEAEKHDLSISRLLIKSALIENKIFSNAEFAEVQQLRQELRRIGINLNQIARSYHVWERGQGDKPESNQLEQIQAELDEVLKSLLKLIK